MMENQEQTTSIGPSYAFIRKLWSTTFAIALALACFIGIVDNIVLFKFGIGLSLTTYGMLVSLHTIMQYLRALRGYFWVRGQRALAMAAEKRGSFSMKAVFLSFGYCEDPERYIKHIRSLMRQDDPDLIGGYFLIDGDGPDNNRMRRIFDVLTGEQGYSLQIWTLDEESQRFNVPYEELDANQRQDLADHIAYIKRTRPEIRYICLQQVHGGKREIMYLGMDLAHRVDDIELYFNTDSDTKMQPDTFREKKYLFYNNPQVAGVTGDVRIDNVGRENGGNLLTRLQNIRYWVAFNIERMGQWKSVMCMSGPRYLVRIAALYSESAVHGLSVLEKWKSNTFLGLRNTFGDDRELTNELLGSRWEICYTPFSTCFTDAPAAIKRFYLQQLRWFQSANREALRTIRYLLEGRPVHPYWTIIDIIYQTFFPILLMIGIVFQISLVFTERSLVPLLSLLLMVFFTGFIRGLIAAIVSRDLWKLLNCLFGFVFMFIMVPARGDAIVHLWDNRWKTPVRAGLNEKGDLLQILLFPYLLSQRLLLHYTPLGRILRNKTEPEE